MCISRNSRHFESRQLCLVATKIFLSFCAVHPRFLTKQAFVRAQRREAFPSHDTCQQTMEPRRNKIYRCASRSALSSTLLWSFSDTPCGEHGGRITRMFHLEGGSNKCAPSQLDSHAKIVIPFLHCDHEDFSRTPEGSMQFSPGVRSLT